MNEIDMRFEELVRKISPVLKRIAYRLNHRFSFVNDEDLFQEALLHLWDAFQKGELSHKTESYILQGCYFYLKNYLRKLNRNVNIISLDNLVLREASCSVKDKLIPRYLKSSFNFLEEKILLEEIQGKSLTKREKEVLCLYLEGFTMREMARRLCISHVRAVKIKDNIKKKLMRLLKSERKI